MIKVEKIREFWDQPSKVTKREEELASWFDGQHYTLSILAEIHSGFIPIVRAHIKMIVRKSLSSYSPPVYKIIYEEKTLYLMGSLHCGLVDQQEGQVLQKYLQTPKGSEAFEARKSLCKFTHAKSMLSPRIQQILRSSKIFAMEGFVQEGDLSESDVRNTQPTSDKFQLANLYEELSVKAFYELGSDSMARTFLAHDGNRSLQCMKFISNGLFKQIDYVIEQSLVNNNDKVGVAGLTPRADQIRGIKENATTLVNHNVDRNEMFTILDIAFFGDDDSCRQYLTPPLGSDLERHMTWRNRIMVNSINDLMDDLPMQSNLTVMVGMQHLYGRTGMIQLLYNKWHTPVTLLGKEIIPFPTEEERRRRSEAVSQFYPDSHCVVS